MHLVPKKEKYTCKGKITPNYKPGKWKDSKDNWIQKENHRIKLKGKKQADNVN